MNRNIKYRTGHLEVEEPRPSPYARWLAEDTAYLAQRAREAQRELLARLGLELQDSAPL